MNQLSRQTRDAMQHLAHCHQTCLSTVMLHCLEMGGEHVRPQHIRLMSDCAAICALTADLLAHKSQFHNRACDLCADVCDTCAADCEAVGGMEDCVTACRECAEMCRTLAKEDHAAQIEAGSKTAPSTR